MLILLPLATLFLAVPPTQTSKPSGRSEEACAPKAAPVVQILALCESKPTIHFLILLLHVELPMVVGEQRLAAYFRAGVDMTFHGRIFGIS